MSSSRRGFLKRISLGAFALRFGRPGTLSAQERGPADWDQRVERLLARDSSDDIIVTAVGDMIFNREISGLEGPEYENLHRITRDADVAFGNLEMSLNETPELQSSPYSLRRGRDFAWEILKIGINMVGLANNHALDYGQAGLRDCLRILRTSGITYAGAGEDLASARKAATKTVLTTRFGLLSYLSSPTARSSAEGPTIATIRAPQVLLDNGDGTTESAKVPLESDVKAMEDAISVAKRNADIVMVHYHFHWNGVNRARPVPDAVPRHQSIVVRRAIDAGADIILGNGPHVLRGIEMYKGKPIFYSLGNFIYQYRAGDIPEIHWDRDEHQDIPEEFQSIVARLTITDKKIRKIDLIPVAIHMEGPLYGVPMLANDERGRTIIELLQRLSRDRQTTVTRNDWYGTVEL